MSMNYDGVAQDHVYSNPNTRIFRRRGFIILITISFLALFTLTSFLFYDSISLKLMIPDIIDRIMTNQTLEETVIHYNLLSPQNAGGFVPNCNFFVIVMENDRVRKKNERFYEYDNAWGEDELLTFCEKCNIVELLLLLEEEEILDGKLCVISDSIAIRHERVVNIVPDLANLIFQINCMHKYEKVIKMLESNDILLKFTLSVVFSSFLESSFYVDTNLFIANDQLLEALFSSSSSSSSLNDSTTTTTTTNILLKNNDTIPPSFITIGDEDEEESSGSKDFFKYTSRFFKLSSTSFIEQFRLNLCDNLFGRKDFEGSSFDDDDDSSREKQNSFFGSLFLEELISSQQKEEDEDDQIGIVESENIFCDMTSSSSKDNFFPPPSMDDEGCLVYDFLEIENIDKRLFDFFFFIYDGCYLDIVRIDK